MEHLFSFSHTLLSFFAVISIIVFIHEMGHYLAAKACGVKILVFSLGFGKEICGFNDRSGTRWKLSLLPLGGYVKMYGDAGAASNADVDAMDAMDADERRRTFHFKPLWQKAVIVAAGPLANFLLTIGVFTWFIFTVGLSSTEPVVGEVMADSPAMEAGLRPGDRVISVNGSEVRRFTDIPAMIATNLGTPVSLVIARGDEEVSVSLTPRKVEEEDAFGNTVARPLIGIRSQEMRYEEVGLPRALGEAVYRTYAISVSTLEVLGQMIAGKRGPEELKGPVGIAQLSGQAAEKGAHTVLWLIALLSANLGLINLLPVPMLDGGHLAFYAVEAARGRPLAERVQEWSFRAGLALVVTLMAFTIFNDIRQLVF